MNFALLGRGFWKIVNYYLWPGFLRRIVIIWLLFGLHLFFGRKVNCWLFVWGWRLQLGQGLLGW
jgi:hypothetical protein